MIVKSKQYSHAAAAGLLLIFAHMVYSFFVTLWKITKLEGVEESYGELIKELFKSEATKKTMYLLIGMFVTILVLLIAMYANNRVLFFIGMLMEAATYGYRLYIFIKALKEAKDVDWDTEFTLTFIGNYVIVGLVVLMLLLMGLSVLCKSSAAKAFGVLVILFAVLGLILTVVIDILPYISDDWKVYRANAGELQRAVLSSFFSEGAYSFLDLCAYFPRFVLAVLVAKWGFVRCGELVADPAKQGIGMNDPQAVNPYSVKVGNPYANVAGYANPTPAMYQAPAQPVPVMPAAPAQPVYQAPAQPVPAAPAQPAYQAPAQPVPAAPAQPAYQAPEQPVYAAPAQPEYKAPEQPVYAAPAQPEYKAPEQPVYAAPAQPEYVAPEQPVYEAPAQPEYTAPEQPIYETPAQPEYVAAPEQPVYAAPEQPVYEAPAEYAAAAVDTASDYATAAVDTASSYADTAVDTANDYAAAAVDTASSYADTAVDTANDYATAAVDTANDYAAAAVDTADGYADAVTGTVDNYVTGYADAAVDTANDYAAAATDTANDYAAAAVDTANNLTDAAGDVAEAAEKLVDDTL